MVQHRFGGMRDEGCGMGHKIEAGCGIREILRPGYGMEKSWRDRDAFISTGGMRDLESLSWTLYIARARCA